MCYVQAYLTLELFQVIQIEFIAHPYKRQNKKDLTHVQYAEWTDVSRIPYQPSVLRILYLLHGCCRTDGDYFLGIQQIVRWSYHRKVGINFSTVKQPVNVRYTTVKHRISFWRTPLTPLHPSSSELHSISFFSQFLINFDSVSHILSSYLI